jgi:hypothetical protein
MKTMSKRLPKIFSLSVTVLASAVALASFVAGCSSPAATDTCFNYATFTGTTPVVTFKADVLPIFQTSCSIGSSCHGTMTGSVGMVFLGPPIADMATQADIDAIFTQAVGASSSKLTSMKIVEAGKPENSFLMYKMDGDLTCADASCTGATCGVAMPFGSPKVGETQLNTVRSWIAQGAKKD